ncbi:MAG: DUF502 domain-containing protein [Bacteroidales bacterium]|nr:DUF502 domain-containing protein [Bacteroidales bacterium]
MNKLIRYFLQGLLLLSPVAITIYAIVVTFQYIDGLLLQDLTNLIGFKIPGLGIIIILTFITLIGVLGSSILIRPMLSAIDDFISRAPLVKIIYTSIKDFMSAFVGKEKKFTEPVLVRMSKDSDLEKIGFVTQHDLSALGIESGKVAVYMPFSYAFSGSLFIVPAANIKPLNANSTEVMKFVVSAGVTTIAGNKNSHETGVEPAP